MSAAIESTKPGVTAIINAGQVARPIERQPSSTAFVVGLANWGPVGVATVITSWAEYLRIFGGFHALGYLADFAYIFFNLFAGKQIIAVRAGKNAAKATLTRANRAGSPAPTFKFEAKYPSSSVDISVSITDIVGDDAKVNIKVKSVALGIEENYLEADLRVAGEVTAINAKSKLVNITLIAATVAGATGRPASGTFALAGGTDGSDTMTADEFAPFLAQFADENLGTGQVAIPGHYHATNTAALTAHAELYNRLALLEPAVATEYDDVATTFNNTPSAHAAVYFPWVEMKRLDGGSGNKLYPPTAFAAGACVQVDRTIGTHKAPANIRVPNALDVERNSDGSSVINDNVREYLNARNINAIAPIRGEGIKIYGARVLAPSGETRVRFVHERRMLNVIYYSAKIGYSWAIFAVVDGRGRLFRDLVSSGKSFLRGFWQAGALYGLTEDEAFIVVADASNNPPSEVQNGRVHVQLGVKLSPTAEQIILNIDSVGLDQNLNVLNGGIE